MNVCAIVNFNPFFSNSATSNRCRTIIEGFTTYGIEVQFIFIQGYCSLKEFKKYGRKGKLGDISYTYTIFLLHNSLWMRRLSIYFLAPLLNRINSSIVRNKILEINPDIIWIQSSVEVLEIYLLAVGKLKKSKFKLMIELNEFNDIGFNQYANKLHFIIANLFSNTLLYKILPETDLLLVMTKHLLEYYKQFTNPFRVRILHLPMTVDINRFTLKSNTASRYIAYCGSSSFIKDGVDIMLNAFFKISDIYSNVKLKIAAFMEADGIKMLSMIKDLNMQHKVDYVGELKRADIPYFLTNAEVLLLPRPDSKQAQGGFPTKLGEYLATGNPVCATKVGDIPDYLTDEESVFFAEPGSIDSFARAMCKALDNPEDARRIGLNGRKIAEKYFNQDVQAKLLYDFLNENTLKDD